MSHTVMPTASTAATEGIGARVWGLVGLDERDKDFGEECDPDAIEPGTVTA